MNFFDGTLADALDQWLEAHYDELVAFRRHLHAQPELAFEEHRTTDYLIERLSVSGLEPKVLSCGTGLVCDVGERPPTVALRADIDALAMDDEVDAPYHSQVPGVAHACGHDVHTTVVLGAGLFLARWFASVHNPEPSSEPRPSGEPRSSGVAEPSGEPRPSDGSPADASSAGGVRLIFQPAEEQVPGGALEVIRDGALYGISVIFGLHCDPKLDTGQVGVTDGAITSAADMFEIALHGPGGHTARPGRTIDLVTLLSRVAIELPRVLRERTPVEHPLLVVFGSVQAGKASNVIPTHGVLRGTARTTARPVWDRSERLIADALETVLADSGAEFLLRFVPGIPPVVNDPSATEVLADGARAVLGPQAVVPTSQSTGGDDFAWLLEHVPGCYARLGVHDPSRGETRFDLHAGHFDVDERAIAVGIRVLVATVLKALASLGGSAP